MKKLLLIMALALCLQSCLSSDEQEVQAMADEHFMNTEYKGHKYVVFMFSIGQAGFAGLEHDPDCPCHAIEGEE